MINEDWSICFEGHPQFDYDECVIYDDDDNCWYAYFETCTWDETYDRMDFIKREVKHCYNCGRKLDE